MFIFYHNMTGVDRVMKSKRQYAFLIESTTLEYQMERNCEIEKIGGLIDNKGYGIALPRSKCKSNSESKTFYKNHSDGYID